MRRYAEFVDHRSAARPGTYIDWVDWLPLHHRKEHRRRCAFAWKTCVRSIPVALLECHTGRQVGAGPDCDPAASITWRLAEVVETWGLIEVPALARDLDAAMHPYLGSAKLRSDPLQCWREAILDVRTAGWAWQQSAWIADSENAGAGYPPVELGRGGCRAKGVIYWTYHTEATGSEATRLRAGGPRRLTYGAGPRGGGR